MSMMMTKMKAESESRMSEEKKISDRRRNIIILISRYLINLGYFDTATKLQNDSNISLDKWQHFQFNQDVRDVADNIDLYVILCEFEQFYEMKFMKPPKLVKKVEIQDGDKRFPKLQNSGSVQGTPSNRGQTTEVKPPTKIARKPSTQTSSTTSNSKQLTQDEQPSMEIQGNAVGSKNKQDEPPEEFMNMRVLKGLPDYSDVPEFQQLAQYLQRDICSENPNVRFSDISGLDQAKRLLKEAVLVPLKYPHFFQGILEPWRGVLLFGPPGTGKTMLAKAVATECRTTFFNIQASSVVSKWRGESEKLIRVLFDLARHYEPSTIFIDELDSIMGSRNSGMSEHEGSRRMKTELLIQLDGLMKGKQRVFLLAASNLPWDLDMAMLRRLEKRIFIPLPDVNSREAMLTKYIPLEMSQDLMYEQYAKSLESYSGSDVKQVCKEACMKPLRRLLSQIEEIQVDDKHKQSTKKKAQILTNYADVRPGPVTNEDFQEAMVQVKPSPSIYEEQYLKWERESGSS